jgi:hypothetical protein
MKKMFHALALALAVLSGAVAISAVTSSGGAALREQLRTR